MLKKINFSEYNVMKKCVKSICIVCWKGKTDPIVISVENGKKFSHKDVSHYEQVFTVKNKLQEIVKIIHHKKFSKHLLAFLMNI